jgi:protein O-GlcNAc transferase
LDLWGKVLAALPASKMILLAPVGRPRPRVLERLARHGIDAGRIEFTDFQPRPEYLQTYQRFDIGLDALPANGHTTSLDSLWMGVPVVTRIGRTAVGRAGWSQLCNLNLRELAAESDEQFVRIAAELAGDLSRLAELRRTLRQRLAQSPLMDAPKFTRGIEAAYRSLWRQWTQKR